MASPRLALCLAAALSFLLSSPLTNGFMSRQRAPQRRLLFAKEEKRWYAPQLSAEPQHLKGGGQNDAVRQALSSLLAVMVGYSCLQLVPTVAALDVGGSSAKMASSSSSSSSTSTQSSRPREAVTPPAVIDIIRDRFAVLRSGITGEKVADLRVGDTLTDRLRALDTLLDGLQKDIYRDAVDWDVLTFYPKVFRAYAPLFTAYTDRAFPDNQEVDAALRYALRYEVGGFYNGVQDFERAIDIKSQRQAQRAFARISIAYDHYLKAGDLYLDYDGIDEKNTDSYYGSSSDSTLQNGFAARLNYIAPSIEAPGLQDEVVLLKGPDEGRKGVVLWIFKDAKFSNNIVVKLDKGESGHSEVRQYPYSLVAKTTPPDVQFVDDFSAAYVASAISSGIMYPIDSFKTRTQAGKRGVPDGSEGGVLGLWNGVEYFIADPNDAIYVASYGIVKPLLLAPIDVTNPLAVFSVLTLSGAVGDALGSFFRVPLELVYKQIQTGSNTSASVYLGSLLRADGGTRMLLLSWLAVLCRDVPFAGLQIALFDVFKTLFSSLDDAGVSIFLQRALWGAFAGGTAAFLTTPFDNLTTNLMLATQSPVGQPGLGAGADAGSSSSSSSGGAIGLALSAAFRELFAAPVSQLFTGAGARILYFSPAAMIFFACYETLTEVILGVRSGSITLNLGSLLGL